MLIDSTFSVAEFEIEGVKGELDGDDHIVTLEVTCCCGAQNFITLSTDALRTLGHKAENFEYARAFKGYYYEIPEAACSKR